MSSNDERVNLLISAAVDGLKNIEALVGELQTLEKTGSEELPDTTKALRDGLDQSSEAMQALRARYDELAKQKGLVEQFASLKKETQELAEQQAEAKASATGLGKAWGDAKKSTEALRVEQANAKQQVAELGKAMADAGQPSEELNAQYKEAVKRVDELGRAIKDSEKDLKPLSREFESARNASREADEAWQANQVQLQQLRDTLSDAGISTKDLASEQVRISKSMGDVEKEATDLNTELTEMRDKAQGAAEGARDAAAGTEDLGKEADKTGGLLSKLGTPLSMLVKGIASLAAAAGASIATLSIFSKRQASLADDLTNTANAIGVSREALQLWQIAGERVGITGDGVANMLRGVTERLGRLSATGSGRAAQIFDALNMDIREFQRLAPDEQLIKLASAIETLPKSEQVGILRTLGSDAERIMPLLENNAEGLRKIREEAERRQAYYTEEELDQLNKANDVYNDINLRIEGLTKRIGAQLAPAVAQVTDRLLDMFDQAGGSEKLIEAFQKVTDWVIRMADAVLNNADRMAGSFNKLGNVIGFFGNLVKSVFSAAMVPVTAFLTILGGVASTFMTALQGIALALNKLGKLSDEAYGRIANAADVTREATQNLLLKTGEFGVAAIKAGGDSVLALAGVKKATDGVTQATEDATAAAEDMGETVTNEMSEAEQAALNMAMAIENLDNDLKKLGIDTEVYSSGLTTIEKETIETFGRIAGNSEATGKQIQDAFLVAIGRVTSTDALGALKQQLVEAYDAGTIGANEFKASMQELAKTMAELEASAGGVDAVGEAGQRAGRNVAAGQKAAQDAIKATAQAAREAGTDFDAMATRGGAAAEIIAGSINQAVSELQALGESAVSTFQQTLGALGFEVDLTGNKIRTLEEQVQDAYSGMAAANKDLLTNFSGSLSNFANQVELAKNQSIVAWGEQQLAFERLTNQIQDGSLAGEDLIRAAEHAMRNVEGLNDAQLNQLQGAIAAARREMDALADSASNTLSSLQDELDRLQGNIDSVEQREYERRRAELQAQIEQARALGDQQAAADLQEALKVLEQINRERQKQRTEQERQSASEKADRDRSERTTTTSEPATRSRPVQDVNLRLPGGQSAAISGDPEDINRLMDYLAQAGMRATQ